MVIGSSESDAPKAHALPDSASMPGAAAVPHCTDAFVLQLHCIALMKIPAAVNHNFLSPHRHAQHRLTVHQLPDTPSRLRACSCILHTVVLFAGMHSTGSLYTSHPISPSRSTTAQVVPTAGVATHRTTSYSSAGPTSAPASPTKIDGKEFFKQAR